MNNRLLLLAALGFTITLVAISAFEVYGEPLGKGRYVLQTKDTTKFHSPKQANIRCARRHKLPYYYSKDAAQRKKIRANMLRCYRAATNARKIRVAKGIAK